MLSHRHSWSSSILLFLFSCFAFAGSADSPPIATYHTTTYEVRVAFFATDDNRHPVTTVTRNDFAIVDNDTVVREFRSFTPSDEAALDVVVMVDASESVTQHFTAVMSDVLRLVSEKQPATEDNLSVVSFSGRQVNVICSGNCRSMEANQKLLSVKAAGPTPLFDALEFGANFISNRNTRPRRPVLIVFSDGSDTISKTSAPDSLRSVIDSGALLYTVDLNDRDKAGYDPSQSNALQRMAEATGGRSFSIREGATNALQAVLADLRATYVVTYLPPSGEVGFHTLRILPKHNLSLRFHCRSGYYYGARIP